MEKPTVILPRIAAILTKVFGKLIDMSDWQDNPPEQQEAAFLSRAVAAACLKNLTEISPEIAGAAITDSYHDGGVDALYFDQDTDRLIFVESKWSKDGTKPINGKAKSTADFVDSVLLLCALKLDRFSDKIRKKEAELKAALYSQRNIRIVLVTGHTAAQPMGEARQKIEDLVERLNADGIEIASAEYFDLARLYSAITTESAPPKINLPIYLRDWGVVMQPFAAYTGKVHVLEVTKWWQQYGPALCYKNLRYLLQRSNVNDALRKTLTTEPEYFWYFNNGITIVCANIVPSLQMQESGASGSSTARTSAS